MSGKRLVGMVLIIVAMLVVVGGGVFFLVNQKNNSQANTNPTPNPTGVATQTTAPQATAIATAQSNLPANMLFDDEFNGSTVDTALWNIVSKSSARGNGKGRDTGEADTGAGVEGGFMDAGSTVRRFRSMRALAGAGL